MRDKKVIVLIVLGIVAVFSLVYGIFTPSNARRQSLSGRSAAVKQAQVMPSGAEGAPAGRRYKRTSYPTWKRSPFLLPTAEESGQLKLKGILWNTVHPKAIINDEILQIGDTIGGVRVINIRRDSVIVNDGSRTYELMLE